MIFTVFSVPTNCDEILQALFAIDTASSREVSLKNNVLLKIYSL